MKKEASEFDAACRKPAVRDSQAFLCCFEMLIKKKEKKTSVSVFC